MIDARFVGGIAQSANHSCSPSCIVERWEVAEIAIEYGKEFARCVHNILYTIVSGTDESCRCKK
ncbi:hypothetical protein JG688_00013609 [Phytophthora aleatoria]|uniref:SET domain-containing protein n=1 Tax=Phytophthora aleatoria TaxID=2496075 RepID=A0A8J5M3V6_9STRA|nr:hypothetical protein JG688_00013609 [Phytophthora aleatoria]